ncbi:MAG: hypothetical protein ACYSVY_17990, partial [Planctomycetota bacterium]|jgi:hypothetical protein
MNGKTGGGEYDRITFYDTTASDGFIERDDAGNPISPPLEGVLVTTMFHYDLSIDELPGDGDPELPICVD